MSLGRTATRGALFTLGGQWVKFLIQTLALILLARMLDPSDFGVYAMAMAVVGVALLFGDFGLSMATIQAKEVSSAQRSNLFWINVLIGVTCASVVFLLADPIASFYGKPEVGAIVRSMSLVFLLQATSAQFSANASRQFRFKLLAGIDICAQAVGLAAAIGAAISGMGYWALVLQQIAAAMVTLGILLISSQWWPGLPRRHVPLRSFVKFGSNTLGVQLVNYLSSNVDNVVLGRFSGASTVGIYDRAYQVFRLPLQQIAAPMTRVALPVLSRVTDPIQFDEFVGRAQLLLTYALGGLFAVAVAAASPLMNLVLGSGWGDAPMLFSILAIGGVFQSMGYVYYWVFLAKGMTGLQLRFSLISRILMVALICAGVFWGAIGVAVAVAVGLASNWLILTIFAVPRTGVRVGRLVRKTVVPLVVYLVMLAVVSPISLFFGRSLSAPLLFVVIVAACLVVLALIYVLVPRVQRDFKMLIRTVKAGLRRA